MSFYGALFLWLVLAAVMVVAVVAAMKSALGFLMFLAVVGVFALLFTWYGCLSPH